LRLYIRLFQWWEATLQPKRWAWDRRLVEFLLHIELRDTVWLEVIGLVLAVLTMVIALQFLRQSKTLAT
jgi:hypothetical protein